MEETLKVINELQEKGIIKKYAIGNGSAAVFYIEPLVVNDIDIFYVPLDENDGFPFISTLYEYLIKRGFCSKKSYIVIEGTPVQFLPVFNKLIAEAVNEAAEIKYKNVEIKVTKLEYLIAIMLQTFNPKDKDKERLLKLMAKAEFDRELLGKIIEKFNLELRFRRIMKMMAAR
jgi:hypothetical protein